MHSPGLLGQHATLKTFHVQGAADDSSATAATYTCTSYSKMTTCADGAVDAQTLLLPHAAVLLCSPLL
jgi:hypothetical protein